MLWLDLHLSNNHQETLGRGGVLPTGPGKQMAHLGQHSKVEVEGKWAWGSAFIGVKGKGLEHLDLFIGN